jgi:hypothetical protein
MKLSFFSIYSKKSKSSDIRHIIRYEIEKALKSLNHVSYVFFFFFKRYFVDQIPHK